VLAVTIQKHNQIADGCAGTGLDGCTISPAVRVQGHLHAMFHADFNRFVRRAVDGTMQSASPVIYSNRGRKQARFCASFLAGMT
jgi:hypothetical protein